VLAQQLREPLAGALGGCAAGLHRALAEGVANLEARLIQPDDPGAAAGADLVFLCDVLHHVAEREAWLNKLAAAMQPGARLALIEFKAGELPEGPPEAAKIGREALLALLAGAGFTLSEDHAALLPYQEFLVFRRP
jgi:2-polyprenyl-3-methyl-5-hydroxy-6-metoxy-1,4-benzoquinol methylase